MLFLASDLNIRRSGLGVIVFYYFLDSRGKIGIIKTVFVFSCSRFLISASDLHICRNGCVFVCAGTLCVDSVNLAPSGHSGEGK